MISGSSRVVPVRQPDLFGGSSVVAWAVEIWQDGRLALRREFGDRGAAAAWGRKMAPEEVAAAPEVAEQAGQLAFFE